MCTVVSRNGTNLTAWLPAGGPCAQAAAPQCYGASVSGVEPNPIDAAQRTDADRRSLVEAIHRSDGLLVLAVAGGGNAVITDLLNVPGASRTVLEIRVPYAQTALDELVGLGSSAPVPAAGAVSQDMAEAMALACHDRAAQLAGDSIPDARLLGVACTAALVTDRERRGDNRAHIAIATADRVVHRRVDLTKGELDRTAEDRVVADALLRAVAAALGLDVTLGP